MGDAAKGTDTQSTRNSAARKKRVRRLKKMIIGSVLLAILIPVIICVILGVRLYLVKGQLREIEAQRDALLTTMADGSFHMDIGEPEEEMTEAVEEVTDEETGDTHTRKVYLTFDDGPSDNTLRILDILEEYGVKATFFVTGEEAKSHPERYQAIVEGGHTLGMHSYSHKYREIYASLDDFGSDLLMLQEYLEETTHETSVFYRFPGGSSNTVSKEPMSVFCDYLTDNGITYFDWNISSKDAANPMRSADEIIENCTANLERFDNAVILMHDAANKSSTVEALPEIIERIQAMEDTEILPITEDTVVIHH